MIIYNKSGNTVLDMDVDDTSYRYRSIRKEKTVTLYYALEEHVDIPTGSYIDYQGERYTLWLPENFEKRGTRNFEYTVIFGDLTEFLKLIKYKNRSVRPLELKFTIWADPEMLLDLIVDNLNEADPTKGWSKGDFIQATRKTFSFNHEYCYDVLQRMADEYNTEWEVEGKTIHFKKIEKFKDNPLKLSYGKGNGFLPGTGRANQGKSKITKLYVQGGDRNIDYSKYGSHTLLLPKNQELEYEGRRYKTDLEGVYITRAGKVADIISEDSFDGSHIFPSRTGVVSSVETIDTDKHLYSFHDRTVPATLNFEEYIMEGETMTVEFLSGGLISREFDVKYTHDERRFSITPATLDGFDLPNESLKPEPGDTYAVFNIGLPDSYICDNDRQEGASWDMFREAVRYFYGREDDQFSFTGELDGLLASRKWGEIGGQIVPGGYVEFSDEHYQPEGLPIRITGIKDYLHLPHQPQIELSTVTVGGSVGSELGKLEAQEVVNETKRKSSVQYTARRWRDAVEHLSLIENTVKGFDAGINPVWVRAMSMLIGDETLQFQFVDQKTDPITRIDSGVRYGNETKKLTIPQSIIQHMTVGIKSLSSSHSADEYSFWDLPAYESPYIDHAAALYFYAKCSKTQSTGVFLLSKTPFDFDNEDGNYYLLVGTLSSEFNGIRSYVDTYGYTEILPGRITLDRIVSPDGKKWWDMLNDSFRMGNDESSLSYNINGDGQVVLKGTLVQSKSGIVQPVDVFRGEFVLNTTYYKGDLVTYNGSVYRYKDDIPYSHLYPTDITYWEIYVQKGLDGQPGKKGEDGITYEYIYYYSDSPNPPARPATSLQTDNFVPTGWSSAPDIYLHNYLYISSRKKTGGVWSSWANPTLLSARGSAGSAGPAIVFRGNYTSIPIPRIFYNNAARRDVIKYNDIYYIYKGANGATNNTWSSGNWESFGAQFSSVATDLLLAVNANIGGWIFKNERLESQSGGAFLDGRTGAFKLASIDTTQGGGGLKIDNDSIFIDAGGFGSEGSIFLGSQYFIDPVTHVITFRPKIILDNLVGESMVKGELYQDSNGFVRIVQ